MVLTNDENVRWNDWWTLRYFLVVATHGDSHETICPNYMPRLLCHTMRCCLTRVNIVENFNWYQTCTCTKYIWSPVRIRYFWYLLPRWWAVMNNWLLTMSRFHWWMLGGSKRKMSCLFAFFGPSHHWWPFTSQIYLITHALDASSWEGPRPS